MRVVIVAAKTQEDMDAISRLVMGVAVGKSNAYEVLLEFFDSAWDPQNPPYLFAAIVRCEDEQSEFQLRLRFPTISNDRIGYNVS